MADIIHRIGVHASVQQVHDAVATTDGVAGWWTRDTSGTPAVGGTIAVRFQDGHGKEIGHMAFEVTRLEPAQVWWRCLDGPPEWLGTEVTFDLAQQDGMTILNFGHRGWKEPVEFMAHCSMKWAVFLLSLRGFVETGRGRPSPDDMKIDDWN